MTDSFTDDLKEIKGPALGKKLKGFGINLIAPSPNSYALELAHVLGLTLIRTSDAKKGSQFSDAFALLSWTDPTENNAPILIQIHADKLYTGEIIPEYNYIKFLDEDKKLPWPENKRRGLGVELRLFNCDLANIKKRVETQDGWRLIDSRDKTGHGLEEAYILDSLGYCWVPSQHMT